MDTRSFDTPCGFCDGRGRRDIPRGAWVRAPVCPDCGGTGHLILSEDGDRLLAFVQRHLGRLLQREIADSRAELVSTRAAEVAPRAHAR